MFDSLLEELNQSLILNKGVLLRVPEGLSERYSLKGQGVIRSWLWDVPGFRRWRVTRMDVGEKLQVFNSVAYPSYEKDQPIMGIDLLWFGLRGKLVAILDFQPLLQEQDYFDKYYPGLKLLRDRYQEFNDQATMRTYDMNKYFSPWVLLCRGGIKEARTTLPLVFNEFVDNYFQLPQTESSIKPQMVRKLQISYDIYSAENDPAHGLFKSYFGKDWADRFLKEFLFPQDISRSGFEEY